MGTRGLTKEKIVAEAVAYIELTEQPIISLHELARRLDVKPPSLSIITFKIQRNYNMLFSNMPLTIWLHTKETLWHS